MAQQKTQKNTDKKHSAKKTAAPKNKALNYIVFLGGLILLGLAISMLLKHSGTANQYISDLQTRIGDAIPAMQTIEPVGRWSAVAGANQVTFLFNTDGSYQLSYGPQDSKYLRYSSGNYALTERTITLEGDTSLSRVRDYQNDKTFWPMSIGTVTLDITSYQAGQRIDIRQTGGNTLPFMPQSDASLPFYTVNTIR